MKIFFKKLFSSPHRRYLLIFLCLFSLYYIPKMISLRVSSFIENKIKSIAEDSGIEIHTSSFNYKFPFKINMQNNILKFNKGIPPLQLSNIDFKIDKFFPIYISTKINAYDGIKKCLIKSEKNFSTYPLSLECNISDIKLEKNPFLFSLGVNGQLSGNISGTFESDNSYNVEFLVNTTNAKYDISKSKFGSILKLPKFDNSDIQIKGIANLDNITLEDGNIVNKLLNISSLNGKVSFPFNSSKVHYQITGDVLLTDDGKENLVPWINLIDQNFSIKGNRFKFIASKQPNLQPTVRFNNL